jgi:predicted N-acyltransferase
LEQLAEFLPSLADIAPAAWNAIAGEDYPFIRHEFLYGLETTGCTTAETGWQPCHLLLKESDELIAVMPLYLKSHSYGEYVFDWSWADAWRQSGLDYYPKLLTAIPFTPATGPRLCVKSPRREEELWPVVIQAIKSFAQRQNISSWHLLFPEENISRELLGLDAHRRTATQFHWFNDGYASFDEFLGTFTSRKRKNLRRERARVAEQGLEVVTLTGSEISEGDWLRFYRFYQMTYAKRSGHAGYLTRDFFLQTAPSLGDQVVMAVASQGGESVAGALYFRSRDTLYGRYWGCQTEFDCLHFEACYYQGIEYCIEHGLSRFDPGAQGEHKIQRGFRPVSTWSNHWIADPQLSAAVGDFTRREDGHSREYQRQATELLPFREEP